MNVRTLTILSHFIVLLLATALTACGPSDREQTSTIEDARRQPQSSVDVSPIEIKVSNNVDERLFLLHLLEELYKDWPTDDSNPQELQKALGEIRHRANRHLQDIAARNLDETLASLYEDFTSAIDTYIDFLAKIGKIESDAVAQAEKDSAESGFNAGVVGGATAIEAYNSGSSAVQSIFGAAAIAALVYFADDSNKSQARDAARERAVEVAAQDLQNKLSTYLARAQNAALELAKRYSWNSGEAGFDDYPDQARRIEAVIKMKDYHGLLKIFACLKKTVGETRFG
jgi:hypothetical protein